MNIRKYLLIYIFYFGGGDPRALELFLINNNIK